MKKVIILIAISIICFQNISKAQNKATKAQTISFIEKWFDEMYDITGTYKNANEFRIEGVENKKIKFDTLNNRFSYECEYFSTYNDYTTDTHWGDFTKLKIELDFSKIESISIIIDEKERSDEDKLYIIRLRFNCANKNCIKLYQAKGHNNTGLRKFNFESLILPNNPELTSKVEIPIAFYAAKTDFDHIEANKKIRNAFNHLRKLAGAPEPVNFND